MMLSVTIGEPADGSPIPTLPAPVQAGSGVGDPIPNPPTGGGTSPTGPNVPLTSVPLLSSRPGAPATLYLDFTGANIPSWGTFSPGVVPAYDQDGDPTTFSPGEIASINEIWEGAAEAYSPFNVNVTTLDPGTLVKGVDEEIVIGGDGDWTGGHYGGLSYTGSFVNAEPSIGFVFSSNLNNGDPHDTGEAVAHEAGHGFGLEHQALYDSSGNLLNDYNSGNSQTAPIMGNSYGAARGLWWDGPTPDGVNDIQDDMAVIAGPVNGFGYAPDPYGHTTATATPLPIVDGAPLVSGVIVQTTDEDVFSFTSGAGVDTFSVNVASFNPMLHAKLELLLPDGTVLATADAATLGQTLTENVSAGQYDLVVMSYGDYGDVGQYNLSGWIVASTQTPVPPASPTPPATPPATPAPVARMHLTARPSKSNRIVLNWQAVSGATSYTLSRETGGRHWETLIALPGDDLGYTNRRLQTEVEYRYRIRATTSAGGSPTSAVVLAMLPGPSRSAPTAAELPSTALFDAALALARFEYSGGADSILFDAGNVLSA